MKKKIIIITISLIMILILGIYFSTISNAAIEIKSGTEPHTNIKVTNSYQYCYDMRSSTSTLGNNSLDPHLTLNADWAAVAYLGASTYGSVRDNVGNEEQIGDGIYYSTTNNITGVMDLGKTDHTQTASLLEGYSNSNNRTNLENNINTKYVELLPVLPSTSAEGALEKRIELTKGLGFAEVTGWYSSYNSILTTVARPLATRRGIFGHTYGMSNIDASLGSALYNTTYRPVIWN